MDRLEENRQIIKQEEAKAVTEKPSSPHAGRKVKVQSTTETQIPGIFKNTLGTKS